MPAKITTAIAARNYELIRDAIGSILALELPNQATLNALTYLNAKIYAEKIGAIDFTDTPVVNIVTTDLKFSSYSAIECKGEYTYLIEVYANAAGTSTSQGDKLAAQKCARLAGVIHSILSNQAYKTLGLTGIIHNRQISGAQRAVPRNGNDANNTVLMVMDMRVIASERVTAGAGIAYDSAITNVLINANFNNGLQFEIEK